MLADADLRGAFHAWLWGKTITGTGDLGSPPSEAEGAVGAERADGAGAARADGAGGASHELAGGWVNWTAEYPFTGAAASVGGH